MRVIKFLPLTFFAGIHGFGLFAPYVVVFMTLVMCARWLKSPARSLVPVGA